ncbi:pRL2-8 (plasmid) [Streptomyces sp. NBC_01310]|uniref:pRL2-8 n=1 Tax=Streptomyces sp. NBC_01310 TaxID=2903820 RepID=UPI0035B588F0|nr:pRL2-8 [Streptomyces sp. NBC_01310]
MASKQALNPPKGECTQCWLHAYDSREQHKHLKPRQDCPACVDHMLHGHGNMIVGAGR